MLVENKFIYLSLPRCASSSFLASCMNQNLKVQHFNKGYDIETQTKKYNVDITKVDYTHFEIFPFDHGHEPITDLRDKFGDSYDVISVKRNKYERFISLWGHFLNVVYLTNDTDIFEKCLNLTINDIFFYKTNDLQTSDSIKEKIEIFVSTFNLDKITQDAKEILHTFMTPYSVWHHHSPDIIWFDFNQLDKLEKWVSNKLDKDFKLVKLNSSKYFQSNLILNDEFREKYDSIYLPYDEIKNLKTLF